MKKLLIFLVITSISFAQNEIKSYALASSNKVQGKIIRIDSFPTEYITKRSVDVWLPENYNAENKYNVIYMHDGQNLFDANTTWNNQEWLADETTSKLKTQNKIENVIIVGIHNIPNIRFFDLYPTKTLNYLNPKTKDSILEQSKKKFKNITYKDFNGDNYLKFIVEELKPYIDKTYNTLPKMQNTFIAGASMGGLMSMYAICEYPEVFSGAICMSTHWVGMFPEKNNPIPTSFFKYLLDKIPDAENHKFYFDFGTHTLDQYYIEFENDVNEVFLKKGYSNINFQNTKFEGENHSEASWQKRFDIPLLFMLKLKTK